MNLVPSRIVIVAAVLLLAAAEDYPSYNGSFKMLAQVSKQLQLNGDRTHSVYNYVYDHERKRSAIKITSLNFTPDSESRLIIADFKSGQHIRIKDDICVVEDKEFNTSSVLEQLGVDEVQIALLLNLTWEKLPSNHSGVSRGRPVVSYVQKQDNISVESTWTTNGKWISSTSTLDNEPYEFRIVHENTTVDIFSLSFLSDAGDHQILEIPNGIVCEGYRDPDNSALPTLGNRTFLKYFVEITSTAFPKAPRTVDAYFSWASGNLLYRIDLRRISDEASLSIITSSHHDTAYVINNHNCSAQKLTEFTEFDAHQMLIDPRDIIKFSGKTLTEFFFGFGKSFVFKKKDMKRGMPCNVYIVERSDWPYSAPTNSTWEWCLYMNETKPEDYFPVALDIRVTEKDNHPQTGLRYSYSFYAKGEENVESMELNKFDVSGCATNETRLIFQISSKNSSEDLYSNREFLNEVKSALVNGSGLKESESIRVQHLNIITTLKEAPVIVEFTVLDIPSNEGGNFSLSTTVAHLKKTIDDSLLIINFDQFEYLGVANSLEYRSEFVENIKAEERIPSLPKRTVRAVKAEPSEFAQGHLQGPRHPSLILAYGAATLLFALGIGVAIAEWYIKIHRPAMLEVNI